MYGVCRTKRNHDCPTLIDRFVNSVVVYDDEILINLNYRKGAKRVSFQEIETACAGLDISSLLQPLKNPYVSTDFSFLHKGYFLLVSER